MAFPTFFTFANTDTEVLYYSRGKDEEDGDMQDLVTSFAGLEENVLEQYTLAKVFICNGYPSVLFHYGFHLLWLQRILKEIFQSRFNVHVCQNSKYMNGAQSTMLDAVPFDTNDLRTYLLSLL